MHHEVCCSDVPLPNGSPLKLLKSGAFIPTENEFKTVLPYEKFVILVSLVRSLKQIETFVRIL